MREPVVTAKNASDISPSWGSPVKLITFESSKKMLKYQAMAVALKLFDLNRQTRDLYRWLGNRYGGPLRRRKTYTRAHRARGDLFLELCARHGIECQGAATLEIGTGWVHWHSLYHRLSFDMRMTMFDIWDCRQWGACKALLQDLRQELSNEGNVDPSRLSRLESMISSESFTDLYKTFNMEYISDASGRLNKLPDSAFDIVFSFHVLEHVHRESTDELVADIHRILKHGGWSVHQIGIDDHLAHHDSSASPKQYLMYSDAEWRMRFDNRIQYVNRLQMSEWLSKFSTKNFKTAEILPKYADIKLTEVAKQFQNFSEDDRNCTILTLVHQKT